MANNSKIIPKKIGTYMYIHIYYHIHIYEERHHDIENGSKY